MGRSGAILLFAGAILAASGPAARAATAREAIAELNAQRAANGIPAGIAENVAWSNDCAAHDAYMSLNHTLTHVESRGKPGYTAGGAYVAQRAVLSQGTNWDSSDPYDTAPLHLDQLLAPRLAVLGSADVDGYTCTTTFPGWTRRAPVAPTVYTYPGNGASISDTEMASESPWTPGDLVGLPQPTRTGPILIVLADAPGESPIDNPATLSDATVTGPFGPVEVKTVDGDTRVPSGRYPTLAPYISPGGFIIPVAPLRTGATFHAHVVVSFAGVVIAHDWSFTAQPSEPHSSLTLAGRFLSFASSSPASIRVTFTRANGSHARAVKIAPGRRARLRLSPGTWQACGDQPATATFGGYAHCLSVIVTGVPALRLGPARLRAAEVVFPLHVSAVLRGRRAGETITPLTVRCTLHGCNVATGTASHRTLVLSGDQLVLALPAVAHGVRVTLTTAAFQLADAPWAAARATRTFVHV